MKGGEGLGVEKTVLIPMRNERGMVSRDSNRDDRRRL